MEGNENDQVNYRDTEIITTTMQQSERGFLLFFPRCYETKVHTLMAWCHRFMGLKEPKFYHVELWVPIKPGEPVYSTLTHDMWGTEQSLVYANHGVLIYNSVFIVPVALSPTKQITVHEDFHTMWDMIKNWCGYMLGYHQNRSCVNQVKEAMGLNDANITTPDELYGYVRCPLIRLHPFPFADKEHTYLFY